MEVLFLSQTSNVEGDAQQVNLTKTGGFINRTLQITGNLDGGTFTLMVFNGTSYVDVVDSAITVVPDAVNYQFRSDYVKGKLAGCGASCDVTAVLI